jgi:hypothetical protein
MFNFLYKYIYKYTNIQMIFFCCFSYPKTKNIVQKKYDCCTKCKNKNFQVKINAIFFKDDLENSLDKYSYIIFICDRGHLFEYHGDKKYLRWIWTQNSRRLSQISQISQTSQTSQTLSPSTQSNLSAQLIPQIPIAHVVIN